MKPHTQKFLQQRKFAMVLPMLVLPFIVMIFWALGGGQGSPAQAKAVEKTGLNLQLPDAHFNDEELNKLAVYQQAERDSLKFKEQRESDPYFNLASLNQDSIQGNEQAPVKTQDNKVSPVNSGRLARQKKNELVDPNEAKVNQKLEQLYRELNKKPDPGIESATEVTNTQNLSDPQFSSDVKQLEKMMETMNKENESDPEMRQIGGMLDKILDIQHPDRVNQRVKQQSLQKKGQVFPVETSKVEDNFSLLNPAPEIKDITPDSSALLSNVKIKQNSFYGLDDELEEESGAGNAIEAVIHDTQQLVAGSTVKMRLLNDVYINGRLISKDQFVYGTASINGERLAIAINSIRDNNSLFPVSLSVFDLDGIEGIYIPGAITRDAAKQSSDQAMQSMQFLSMDQSLQAQAASAGLQAAKGLFSKKVKQIKVTLKAGYKIFLMQAN